MAAPETPGAPARWSLQGKTALVTGGTRGIGRAVVEELAALGAAVHTCSRKEAELGERLKEWEAKGFRVTTSVCDLSVRDQRERLVAEAAGRFVIQTRLGEVHSLNRTAPSYEINSPNGDCRRYKDNMETKY